MSTSSPDYAYDDDTVRLSVGVTETAGIRVEAAGTGVGAAVNLTVMGAQRLSGLLSSAITTAIHRGLGGGPVSYRLAGPRRVGGSSPTSSARSKTAGC